MLRQTPLLCHRQVRFLEVRYYQLNINQNNSTAMAQLSITTNKKDKAVIIGALVMMILLGCTVAFVFAKAEYNPIPVVVNNPSRSVNTSYRPNLYRACIGSYTVSIVTGVSLINLNSTGAVYLEISQDNSTWVTINSAGVTRTLSVAISVGLNETTQFNVQGVVPAGWYCRLRTVVSGGATATYTSGQETMY